MSLSDTPREKTLFSRAIGVLAEPGATFQDIAKSPDYVVPVIFIIFIALLGIIPIVHAIKTMPGLLPSNVPMPSESVTIGITLITSIIGQLIVWPVRALVFSGIGAIIGSKVDFRKSLAISGYLNITLVISGIITAIVFAFTGQAAQLGLGMLLPPEEMTTALGVILANINIFSITYIILSSVALSKLWNVKMSKSVFITILMWALVIAVSAGSAHLGSKMTQFQVNVGVSPN